MKQAVVTIAIGDKYKKLSEVTHPTLKAYAEKIGADFVVLDEPGDYPHWEKFKLFDLLIQYNRILYIDTDIIIRDDCPNLFDMVPETKLGIFNEGRFVSREGSLQEACKEYNRDIPKWDGTYYNTGVMVISRKFRSLFKRPQKIASLGMFEQGYINMKILLDWDIEKDIEELDYKFNRMTALDEHCGIHRLDSYVVHYAGIPDQVDAVGLIKRDLATWENKKPKYEFERNVVIQISGGMGDQLASEPVARFAIEKFYKDVKTNYIIVSDWPRLFEHLGVPCMKKEQFDTITRFDTPIKVMKTIPAPGENPIWQTWSHVCAHTTDYAAVCALHKTLPDIYKTIKLEPVLDGLVEAMDIAGSVEDLILVHPGRGWASKTFPASWWEDVISSLISSGKRVGIIGKHISKEQGYVDINVPEGVIDFRDLLSLDGLISLIATAKMVISNDSAPIHIAGAFDKHIILIATCKEPDHVLPYRNGSKYYKAYAFAKKLTVEDWDLSPTRIYKESADVVKGNILDYLPEPKEVVDKALEFYGEDIEIKKQDMQILDFLDANQNLNESVVWNEDYEKEIQDAMKKYLTKSSIAFDIGANFGFFTKFMADIVTEGKIFAFEPERNVYNKLCNNISQMNNVRTFNYAIGNQNKNVELFYNLDNDGGHALWDPALHTFNVITKQHDRIKENVEMITLDSLLDFYVEGEFAPNLIKTDTEGCELLVLEGAKEILEKYKPIVIAEINYTAMELMGTNEVELQRYMNTLGYKTYLLPTEEEIDLSTYTKQPFVFNVLFK